MLFFTMVLVCMSPCLVGAEVISIRADVWCPYNCAPGSDKPGYMIEIAQSILGPKGHTIDYQNMPWTRAIKQTREGKYSAIVGAYIEDAPDFVFAENLGSSTMTFYGQKGNTWRFKDIESLKAVKIGVVKDYAYTAEIDKYIADNSKTQLVQVAFGEDALETNIKKLFKNRIDVFIANEMVISYHIKQSGRAMSLFENCGVLSTDNVHIAFSPKIDASKSYVDLINKGVQDMRASGELKKILDKYGIADWK